ncbi:(2Fe-2S)-binding protein [bacterium]|nr:(2Fe-2S)-binding protein [candidate division CSSED10-310 bacterium]
MITMEVNERTVQAKEGETILTALKRAGISVPTLCYMEGLPPSGACRMCVVEVEGMAGLVPSCAYPVADGMKIKTHSPRAIDARKTIIELLLADHPDDCLYCARNRNCELQRLAEELGVRRRMYFGRRSRHKLDVSSPSIVRDPEKCILCGRCVRACEEIQGVAAIDFIGRGSRTTVGTAFDQGLNVSSCINCGQCVMVCPTGALREQRQVEQVQAALADPHLLVVVQHAPSVSVSLGEHFGLKPGVDIMGAMTAALRRLGFDRVFDTAFAADLTVMEEASELVHRIQHGGVLPMMTSCSPGWVKFVEEFYPDFIPNLSTCKSPQQMLGAVIKRFYAASEGIDPAKVFSVSIMPCTAKKFEAQRPEMSEDGLADIDAVLTTRELAEMIRMRGLDLQTITPEGEDTPFGERSTAGKLFGATGGVMEAAVRTAYHLMTGREMQELKIKTVRGLAGIKSAGIDIGDRTLSVAVVSGLANARQLLEDIKAGNRTYHFIEVMTCPGGCIAGGGQLLGADPEAIRSRMKALYEIDARELVRTAHSNRSIHRLYREFLGEPLSETSHRLLHTSYGKREVVK